MNEPVLKRRSTLVELNIVDRYAEIIAAWSAFEFIGQFDLEGVEITFVTSPTPHEVWQRFSSTKSTFKPTGKSASFEMLIISTWDGAKCTKMTVIYDDPSVVAAICSADAAVPIPLQRTLPSFEPHPDPKACWEKLFALWGAGEMSKPDTKQAMFETHVIADAVMDNTCSALPDILKVYEGRVGIDSWTNDVCSEFDLSNLQASAVAGLKPGCVLQRLVYDVKHKQTGKEAKG